MKMPRVAFLLLLTSLGRIPEPPPADCAGRRATDDGIRAVVVTQGEEDPSVAEGIRALGANTIVTFARPSAAASEAALRAGLGYVAFLSSADVERLRRDPLLVDSLRAIEGLRGFHYYDEAVAEGYTCPETQQRTYATLKAFFPDALVLYATRLDPISRDPAYLDEFYRPQYTDMVAPYFYPVGTTVLGTQTEDDPWEARLADLLTRLARLTPPGKRILPVLQAFEQIGYPVTGRIGARQRAVYEAVWPDVRDVAAFAWNVSPAEPLEGLAQRPILFDGFRRLFGGSPIRPQPCVAPWRVF